jgi:hypothetical protein
MAKDLKESGSAGSTKRMSKMVNQTNGDGGPKNRKVIEDRGRGLGGITQDTLTNKFYSQSFPDVEMDSTHTRNPFDRNIITVDWHRKD